MKKISVLLATRSRTKMLGDSIDSLMTNVSDSENVEIMLGIDNDDQETLDFVQSEDFQNKMQDEYNVDIQAVLFDRLGYKNLHQYMNQLWGQANGEWLIARGRRSSRTSASRAARTARRRSSSCCRASRA